MEKITILHYALGFPPYRTGGLTKFVMDLMYEQEREGCNVSLLWPGTISGLKKGTSIIAHKKKNKIGSFEVINPTPVSYDEGINVIQPFIEEGDLEVYTEFLHKLHPKVLHIHTLMGLHKALIIAAKKLCIKVVFTAHDFFPLCPKVTLYKSGDICRCVKTLSECGLCNNNALSISKIQLLQSPIYRALKDSIIVKAMRKKHRNDFFKETNDIAAVRNNNQSDYELLRNHYFSILKQVDLIHFNSTVTKEVYSKVIDLPNSITLCITHANINDNKKKKIFDPNHLKIRYLGPQNGAKGFFFLKNVLDVFWKENTKFQLDVHFQPVDMAEYLKVHKRYNYDELSSIFDDSDVVICPSIWFETFGYTVLEALSYGVPVIISNHVGAKDIVADGAGIIYEYNDKEQLLDILRSLTSEKLETMNDNILRYQKICTMSDLSKQIISKLYY